MDGLFDLSFLWRLIRVPLCFILIYMGFGLRLSTGSLWLKHHPQFYPLVVLRALDSPLSLFPYFTCFLCLHLAFLFSRALFFPVCLFWGFFLFFFCGNRTYILSDRIPYSTPYLSCMISLAPPPLCFFLCVHSICSFYFYFLLLLLLLI